MRECKVCKKELEGAQRLYCSNRCKQVQKNRKKTEQESAMLAENAKLKRKVKRLENKIKKLESA
jgi:predicted nucleic acid-binding Zn ribbon protein